MRALRQYLADVSRVWEELEVHGRVLADLEQAFAAAEAGPEAGAAP